MSDIKESNIFETLQAQQNHWYYAAKINKIISLLSESKLFELGSRHLNCLDIGAGNGIMSYAVSERFNHYGLSHAWHLVDSAYLENDLLIKDSQFVSLQAIPKNKKYDVILAIDVIEHINEQREFLRLIRSHCNPGALVVITAPALMFLWSTHDTYLEHFRRYRSKELQHECTRSGFHVLSHGYVYSPLLPLITSVIYVKKILAAFLPRSSFGEPHTNMRRTHPRVNSILRLILSFELSLKNYFPLLNKVWGSTAFVFAKT